MATALAVLSPMASAYYYWIYFANHNGPFAPVPARFDIANLPNHTIPFLISSQGPTVLMPGDSYNAIISQLRAAADVWNGVSSSAARMKFAGLSPLTQPDVTPEVDIVFDSNITPGLLAMTQITTAADVSTQLSNGATFIPIQNAEVHFYSNLAVNSGGQAQPSFSDSFFLTMVHELGHSLGLQHTLTSSVMSTQPTSAVTKAAPLSADDIAGVSLLYPAASYAGTTGSITGTVQLGGAGVNMASVVALSTNGTAVSGITNPDGTYRIDGIPAGAYYVYTHPLPPPGSGEAYPDNMLPPQDARGFQYLANTGFGSQFFGGTTDWTQTTPINITAGQETDGVNFNVSARPGGPAVSTITTYGVQGPTGQACTAQPCNFVNQPPIQAGTLQILAFFGNGITTSNGNVPAPGLQVSVIGATAPALTYGGLNPYGVPGYVFTGVEPSTTVTSTTQIALAFRLNGDLYVLPNAFSVVPGPPPAISSVKGTTDGNGNATVNIAGANLSAKTKILFDGSAATISQVNQDGSLTVAAPPATAGYRAVVEALAPDSQTSAQLLGAAAPPAFVYGGPGTPQITVNPPVVQAGTDTTIEISGSNTNFVEGQTVVGFGSSDVTITHVWVVSPGLLQMNISVNASANAAPVMLTVASGLQLASLTASLQIAAANPAPDFAAHADCESGHRTGRRSGGRHGDHQHLQSTVHGLHLDADGLECDHRESVDAIRASRPWPVAGAGTRRIADRTFGGAIDFRQWRAGPAGADASGSSAAGDHSRVRHRAERRGRSLPRWR